MLKKIELIQGIGLFYNANGKPHTFDKATLIYAENGRGKSTLANILRSVATNNPSLLSGRTTLDGSHAPKCLLNFDSGHKVKYEDGAWSEKRPELLVFDADFIEKNVHSGGEVNTHHRKNLLEFALGEQAVLARKLVDAETKAAKAASDDESVIKDNISRYHSGVLFKQFEALQPIVDADIQIQALQKRIIAASSIQALVNKQLPSVVAVPTPDIDGLFSILGRSLEQIQEDADRIVREHISLIGHPKAENWLSLGHQLGQEDNCPYCCQPLKGIEIIQAYKSHFNAAYEELKIQVSKLENGVSQRFSDQTVELFASNIERMQVLAFAWKEYVPLNDMPFDKEAAYIILRELRVFLQKMVTQKMLRPTEVVGNHADKEKAKILWGQVTEAMELSNQAIAESVITIKAYRNKLAAENIQQLEKQIQSLELAQRRHTKPVVDLLAELKNANSISLAAEQRKKIAKNALNILMTDTLAQYQTEINKILPKLGASFTIHEMNANFLGSGPRSEYELLLRGKNIPLDGQPSFSTTLSEGDKRTLAFAFFIASILTDQNLDKRIVVIDDPMSSLDINRKQYTRTTLKTIFNKTEQLIVLAHDLYFIRDLRNDLSEKNDSPSSVRVFKLRHTVNDYTDFANVNIDHECESRYMSHHRVLSEFSESTNTALNLREVAKSIRPLLEGYLHRRFPRHISKKLLFGQIVCAIKDANPPSPLVFAKGLVEKLNEVNSYAGQFHHDTNPDADNITINHTELLLFVKSALDIVHKGESNGAAINQPN